MPELDKETQAALHIRCDELCSDMQIDVMKQFAGLRASRIILETFFEQEMPAADIIQFAIYLSNEEKKSA